MPGLRFKLWPIFGVKKFPWVQVPAGEIGVVIAQVGAAAADRRQERASTSPSSATSPTLETFIDGGGQKGVQRPVLAAGHAAADPPRRVHGASRRARSTACRCRPSCRNARAATGGVLRPESFGLTPEQLQVVVIAPAGPQDMVGIVTTLEGEPLAVGRHRQPPRRLRRHRGDGAGREHGQDSEIIEVLLGIKNDLHNNYQDFQQFLDAGGHIGLQHDPLLYGAYLLNPFLVRVEMVPMLVVNQGEVAVIKAYVGLPTLDTSGAEFKFGSIVRPGHRGIWQEPLRTGKYPINPRVYAAEIVPTSILTLNWAEAVSTGAQPRRAPRRRSRRRAARASCSASTCRCRSTCPTRARRRSSRWSARCRTS